MYIFGVTYSCGESVAQVVPDRRFNTASLMAFYLDRPGSALSQAITWSSDNPNVLDLKLPGASWFFAMHACFTRTYTRRVPVTCAVTVAVPWFVAAGQWMRFAHSLQTNQRAGRRVSVMKVELLGQAA